MCILATGGPSIDIISGTARRVLVLNLCRPDCVHFQRLMLTNTANLCGISANAIVVVFTNTSASMDIVRGYAICSPVQLHGYIYKYCDMTTAAKVTLF